jgi:epoxyqueuosine reductase
MTLSQRLTEKAYELGFDLIGIAPANRAPHADAYQRWLAQGYAGEMGWLAREPERRADPRLVLPGVEAVLVVGLSYFALNPPAHLWADPARGRVARYAWGPDYHHLMLPRLHALGDFAEKEARQVVNRRVYVDTGPILERDIAAQAGLGFIGKNTLLIRPGLGSYLFLGEILLDVTLEYETLNETGTCGRCARCLNACPTQALVAPYTLDSRRCLSYLTIEHRGAIPLEVRPLLGNWIFGCDACQEICPWVRRYAQPPAQPLFQYNPDIAAPRLLEVMALNEAGFRARFGHTPLARAQRRGLLRNVAVALGNGGRAESLPVLQQALADPEPLIQEHAAWAIAQIKLRQLQENNYPKSVMSDT